MKSEKPASKRRVKASDSRGKTMGFADNVFDQKRGRRESNQPSASSPSNDPGHGSLPGVSSIVGRKRPLAASHNVGPSMSLRKIELPTPESDRGSSVVRKFDRETPGLFVDTPYANANGTVPRSTGSILPGVKSIAEGSASNFHLISPPDDSAYSRVSTSTSPGIGTLPSAIGLSPNASNTLPPMLGHGRGHGHGRTHTPLPHQTSPFPSLSNGTASTNSSMPAPSVPPPSASSSALALLNESMHQDTKSPTTLLDASIADLEAEIRKLKGYEEEIISLGLDDSRKMLGMKVSELEERVRGKKREKAVVLMERLKREGLGELASVVGREVGVDAGGGVRGLEGGIETL